MSELINQTEIDYVKSHVIDLDPLKMIHGVTIVPPIIKPYCLKSDYLVSYSIDFLSGYPPMHHVSIKSGSKSCTDPADAEIIAKAILGEKYMAVGAINLPSVLHFYSCTDMERMIAFLTYAKKKWELKRRGQKTQCR